MQDDEEGWIAESKPPGRASFGTASIAGPGCIRRRNFIWPFVGYASRRERADFKKSRCAAMCGERYGPRSPLCLWASWGSGSPYCADPSAF